MEADKAAREAAEAKIAQVEELNTELESMISALGAELQGNRE